MSKVSDFKEGDEVEHKNLGPGTVIEHDGVTMRVQYEGKWAEVTGSYDDSWFAKYSPPMLTKKA